jgi:putative membrane protein
MLKTKRKIDSVFGEAYITRGAENTFSEKERIPMFWGFGHGLFLLLPFLLFGRLFWLIILGVLIWSAIRWLSTRNRHIYTFNPGTPPARPSALEILRQRYARGEIDTATYEQMRERLEKPGEPYRQ